MKNKLFIILALAILVLFGGCSKPKIVRYDEVVYDCGSRLIKGTQVPGSAWDLENGVEVYYLYADNYSIEYNYTMREWFEHYSAVVLYQGEGACKEILRFYNYTNYIPS